mgnify:CR=1 FL=1
MTTVSIFGLGYVGSVVAACLSRNGNGVIGVDVNPIKTTLVAQGQSPIMEKGLEELLRMGSARALIRTTMDAVQAVIESEVSMICVGTPSNYDGKPDLSSLIRVSEKIGRALKAKSRFHVVVVRSTVLPGTTEEVVIPILEKCSGKRAGVDFGVCFNPEFLREGTAIEDFYEPPFTVIGSDDERAVRAVSELYSMLTAPVFVVPFRVAEMLKYANNAFHALKVCFANEIGILCRRQGIDSHQVMEMFCRDTKLNLSRYYLTPGFAFGGACLPKDLRGLLHRSRHLDLSLPVLESILRSNTRQVEVACEMVEESGRRRVGICGFSFKAGTDDLRESPMVRLIEFLLGKGFPLRVYDESVSLARLHGTNRAYIEQAVPHIASLIAHSLEDIIEWAEVIVIGSQFPQLQAALAKLRPDQKVIDLVGTAKNLLPLNGQYQGICW